MTERTARIAISITNPVAQQLAVTMFSSAGARVDVFENIKAILDVADTIQAIVLGLDAFPDETLEALTSLRERLAKLPIYVITAAAGQRHAKRAQLHGATRVIPYGELEQQIESLVQEIAQSSGISNADVHPPGWVPPSRDQGYDVESMDLNDWLSSPENRRLLGMRAESINDNSATATTRATPQAHPHRPEPGTHRPSTESIASTPPRQDEQTKTPPTAATTPGEIADGANFQRIVEAQHQHDQQNAAIAEDILQREQDIRAELKREFLQAISEQIATSEAKLIERIDQSLANTTRGNALAIRKVKLMAGVLAAAAVLLVIAAVGGVWALGAF